jgi:fructose-bisphosphate aldolase class I
MILPGKESPKASVKDVAEQTVDCLKKNVPKELAGVVFLSGGQTDEESAAHLSTMHQLGTLPWPLSFSYGRAIQAPALKIWSKNLKEVAPAQAALLFRSKMCSLASLGQYTDEMEKNRPY